MNVRTRIKYLDKIPFYIADTKKQCDKAVILFPEAFGITGHAKDVAHRLARDGFRVYLMQLYYEQVNDPSFSISYSDKETREANMKQLDDKAILSDLSTLKDHFKGYQTVISLGFSIGGYFALSSATILDFKQVFAYYPNPTINNKNYNLSPIDQYLKDIVCPVSLFFGAKDHSINENEIFLLKKNLPHAEIEIYKKSSHGFFCNSRHVYNKDDARKSWEKILSKIS